MDPSVGHLPATAVDAQRVYVDWFGIYFAVDLHTGKLLWRSESFANLGQTMNGRFQNRFGVASTTPAVVPMGKNVLFTGFDNSANGQQGGVSRLVCLTADLGKTVWNSEHGRLSDWNFIGSPILTAAGIYACAYPSSNTELHLLCIAPTNGELLWETTDRHSAASRESLRRPVAGIDARAAGASGNALRSDQQRRGGGRRSALAPDRLGIQIRNAGDRDTAAVFLQRNGAVHQQHLPAGAMLAEGSTLYVKEVSGSRLYALDLTGPSLKWSRPVESSVTLAAARGRELYLVGDEVDCIDADSRALQWSDKLSSSSESLRPLLSGDRFYVFDERGVHGVHIPTGDTDPIFRGYDRDGSGGILWQSEDRLVTVSAVAITAYRVATIRKQGDRP